MDKKHNIRNMSVIAHVDHGNLIFYYSGVWCGFFMNVLSTCFAPLLHALSAAVFILLAIQCQKAVLKVKSAILKCLLIFSIAIIRSNIVRFLYMVQVCSQKYKLRFKKLFSYLACGQIWLNLHVDHCHFGYINKKQCLQYSEL